MAGLPKQVIKRASEILNYHLANHPSDQQLDVETVDQQMSIFAEQESALKADLTELDVLNLSPLEAIRRLDELKKKHGL